MQADTHEDSVPLTRTDAPVSQKIREMFQRGKQFIHTREAKQWTRLFLLALGFALLLLLVTGALLAYIFVPRNPYRHLPEGDWSWGVVIDLGSSGSRVHIFQWNSEKGIPAQPGPVGHRNYWVTDTRPGLSSFASNVEEAVAHIHPLLDFATHNLKSVNANLTTVPVFMYATGGVRMLSRVRTEILLDSLRGMMAISYPHFRFERSWADTIPSREESILDWMAMQQTLLIQKDFSTQFQYFQHVDNGLDTPIEPYYPGRSVAVIDVGGASLEFAAEPDESLRVHAGPSAAQSTRFDDDDGDGTTDVYFHGDVLRVYARGFPHLGHHEFANRFNKYVYENFSTRHTTGWAAFDPCTIDGLQDPAEFLGTDGARVVFVGRPDTSLCMDIITELLDIPEGNCGGSYCTMGGVSRPSFDNQLILGVNEFVGMRNFFGLDMQPYLFELRDAALECIGLTLEETHRRYGTNHDHDVRGNCFEGLFLYLVLTKGFGLSPHSNQVLFSDNFYFYGNSISWTLGAMAYQVDQLGL